MKLTTISKYGLISLLIFGNAAAWASSLPTSRIKIKGASYYNILGMGSCNPQLGHCEGELKCEIKINNSLCSTGDPAPGWHKTLRLHFVCVNNKGEEGRQFDYWRAEGPATLELSCVNLKPELTPWS